MNSGNIIKKFEQLPEDLKREVSDYIEFLSKRYGIKSKRKKFNFSWEGGLSELKTKYSSVDLQHQVLELR